ncbi:MAG: C40 family peptidase [Desulfosporosinus fructosivorans]
MNFTKLSIYRRPLLCMLVPILFCSFTHPVYASPPDYNNINTLRNGASFLEDQAKVSQQQENSVVSQAESIQQSIDVLKSTIDKDNLDIEQRKEAIVALNAEIQILADQQKKDTETLGNFVSNQYTEADTPFLTYVSWLASSTSSSDLINRYSSLETILSFYRDLKAKVADNSDVLRAKQSLEQDETNKLTAKVQSNEQLIDGLSVALAKQTSKDELQAAQAQSRGQQSPPVKLNGQVGQLLSFASNFLGVPYTWGGTYPQFDCSSYVQYVYGHFGIELNRVTWDQYGEGQSVSRDKLAPGDLVFFSTYQPGPSHIGIYVGNGIMINSSNSGVSYASINSEYWSSKYYGARRVIAQ